VADVSLVADVPSVKVETEPLSEASVPAIEERGAAGSSQGITPDIVAVIEAAVAAFVGKKVAILSVRLLGEADADANAWASQGRDIIQTSHNLVQRGH
jgi:hypothetical protein